MKKNIVLALLLASSLLFAQEVEPKYEIVGQLIKATYYYENGQTKQEGFYKDGKVHGKWVSFNNKGEKTSIGEYNKGEKAGKWFFWDKNVLSEVDYANNRIAEIKNWQKEALANRN